MNVVTNVYAKTQTYCLREGVVVCKADTTMEQLKHFAAFADCVSALQLFKSIFTVTKGIARIQVNLLHGSLTIMPISFGTG